MVLFEAMTHHDLSQQGPRVNKIEAMTVALDGSECDVTHLHQCIRFLVLSVAIFLNLPLCDRSMPYSEISNPSPISLESPTSMSTCCVELQQSILLFETSLSQDGVSPTFCWS